MTLINIKDVTNVVKNQQKVNNLNYMEAFENNFSHENMTPLNCILSSSFIVKKRLLHIYAKQQGIIVGPFNTQNQYGIDDNLIKQMLDQNTDARDTINIITSVEHSAKSMWFYNQNQIKRMKVMKNQLKVKKTSTDNVFKTIQKVAEPFQLQIEKGAINLIVYQNFDQPVTNDWKLYELILYNLISNSVKYNVQGGDIVILLEIESTIVQGKTTYNLITQVVDSGQGISDEREKMLFIPYLELKSTQGISATDSIGLGLACSKSIVTKMGGDIFIKKSFRGLTVVEFFMPIEILTGQDFDSENQSSYRNQVFRVFGEKKQPNYYVRTYLNEHNIVLKDQSESVQAAESDQSRGANSDLPKSDNPNLEPLSIQSNMLNKRQSQSSNAVMQIPYKNTISEQSEIVVLSDLSQQKEQLKKYQMIFEFQSKKQNQVQLKLDLDVHSIEESKHESSNVQISQEEGKQEDSPNELIRVRNQKLFNEAKQVGVNNLSNDKKRQLAHQLLVNNRKHEEFEDFRSESESSKLDKPNIVAKRVQSTPNIPIKKITKRKSESLNMNRRYFSNKLQGFFQEQDEPEESEVEDILVNEDDIRRVKKKIYLVNDSDSSDGSIILASAQKNSTASPAKKFILSTLKKTPCRRNGSFEQRRVNQPNKYRRNFIEQLSGNLSVSNSSKQLSETKCTCEPRVMIVDDTAFNLFTLRLNMKECFDMPVEEAENGQISVDKFKEALKKPCNCRNRAFKLIIMDVQMPVLDGIEATKKIKELISKVKQPINECIILALTAATSNQVLEDCLRAGMKETLAKPLTVKKLEEIMFKYFFCMTEDEVKEFKEKCNFKAVENSQQVSSKYNSKN